MGTANANKIEKWAAIILAVAAMGASSAAFAMPEQVGTIYHYERTNSDGSMPRTSVCLLCGHGSDRSL